MFTPNLSILPGPQRQLWAELKGTPKTFVLYGGTALALRLGHRQSEDFDFFSNQPFHPNSLRDSVPYLKNAEMTQFHDNTLTAIVDRNGPVKLSFFGSLGIKRAQDPAQSVLCAKSIRGTVRTGQLENQAHTQFEFWFAMGPHQTVDRQIQ